MSDGRFGLTAQERELLNRLGVVAREAAEVFGAVLHSVHVATAAVSGLAALLDGLAGGDDEVVAALDELDDADRAKVAAAAARLAELATPPPIKL